jgi:hypothetical protein
MIKELVCFIVRGLVNPWNCIYKVFALLWATDNCIVILFPIAAHTYGYGDDGEPGGKYRHDDLMLAGWIEISLVGTINVIFPCDGIECCNVM